jgi:hypothetical protein
LSPLQKWKHEHLYSRTTNVFVTLQQEWTTSLPIALLSKTDFKRYLEKLLLKFSMIEGKVMDGVNVHLQIVNEKEFGFKVLDAILTFTFCFTNFCQ